MDDRAKPLPLWWVLGTFHPVALVTVLAWFVYRGGTLGQLLSGLSTLSGIALFVALWAISLFTARRALRDLDWLSDDPRVMGTFFWRALRWGAATGLLFLLALTAGVVATALGNAAQRNAIDLRAFVFVPFYLGFGSLFAAAIGGVVGVTLGALDIAALRIARALTRTRASASQD